MDLSPQPRAAAAADLIDLRRDLHQNPELRFAEHRTAALLGARLETLGFHVLRGVGGTGVVGTLTGAMPGPHIVLRADMDAMPVRDLKDVPYASRSQGIAHACGHDVHMTVVAGVAQQLATAGISTGRVTVVFQPAEERPFGEPSGAAAMLADGLLRDMSPTAILGLHCWPDLPAGTVGIDDRVAMGAKDAFRIRLMGRAVHAATPSRGRDAVLGLTELVSSLYAGVSRSLDPNDVAAFNIGTISGGRSQSVVPGEGEITGTLRTVDGHVRARLKPIIERHAASIAASHDLGVDLLWADEMPPVLNDPHLVAIGSRVAASVLGEGCVHRLSAPPMTADDFALLSELGPSLYLKLGVAGDGQWPGLHSGTFDVDERCIPTGVSVMNRLVMTILENGLGGSPDASAASSMPPVVAPRP